MQEKRDAEMEGCSKGGIPPDCKDLGQSKEILGICLFYQTSSPGTLFKVLISLRYRCPYRAVLQGDRVGWRQAVAMFSVFFRLQVFLRTWSLTNREFVLWEGEGGGGRERGSP